MGDILLLLFGAICVYWALGSIFMVLKGIIASDNEAKDYKKNTGWLILAFIITGAFSIYAIPTGWNGVFGEDDIESYEYDAGSSNPSFKGKGGYGKDCNISSHNCTGFVDENGDNYCDVCISNGYKCHKVYHTGKVN